MLNEETTISKCLDSIFNVMEKIDEVIVVDNGSSDRSKSIVRSYGKVMLIEKPDATLGALRNSGAQVASGNLIAFIDADCVIDPLWRTNVVQTFQNPLVTVSGARYSIPSNPIWIEKVWYSQKKFNQGEVSYINSGNFIIRKKCFIRIGGFDVNLLTGEDTELCIRLKSRGFMIWENPDIKAIHLGNPKTLKHFYMQQRWHALGMFGTFRVSKYDKPIIMTLLNITFLVVAAMLIPIFFISLKFGIILCFSTLISAIPLVTSIYRSFHYKNFKYIAPLTLLYSIYYFARAQIMAQLLLKKWISKT